MAAKTTKPKSVYDCSECGAGHSKWAGQCPGCGAWNSLVETVAGTGSGTRFGDYAETGGQPVVELLRDVQATPQDSESRHSTNLVELDRVLGGGLVPGSVILIGGDPGIGKSTLLLQTLVAIGRELPSLYVTGEESLRQIGLRARRLAVAAGDLRLLTETSVERILALAREQRPRVMVIDSIQTLFTEILQSAPGSLAQVRESAARLVRFAKQTGTALFLIGHVTKEGALAGPRVLEHMVDTVLYFEGDSGSPYRVIRAVKNRFGAANEIGVFAMTEKGLKQVSNPSAIFLSRHEQPVPGSTVMVTREGTRPLLVEAQALVTKAI